MLCRFTRDPSARRLTEESGLRPAAAAARAEGRGADQAAPPPPLAATTAALHLPARPSFPAAGGAVCPGLVPSRPVPASGSRRFRVPARRRRSAAAPPGAGGSSPFSFRVAGPGAGGGGNA